MTEINHYACDKRIAQLEAENAKLRAALERVADDEDEGEDPPFCPNVEIARAALAEIKEGDDAG